SAVDFRKGTAGKWSFTGKREPNRFAQRINVGAYIQRGMFKLFRTRKCWRTNKSATGQRFRIRRSVKSFSQTEINYFYHGNPALAQCAYSTSLGPSLIAPLHFGVVRIYEHQICWL